MTRDPDGYADTEFVYDDPHPDNPRTGKLKDIENFQILSLETWDGQEGIMMYMGPDGEVEFAELFHRGGLGYVTGSKFWRDEQVARKLVAWLQKDGWLPRVMELTDVDDIAIRFMKEHMKGHL